MSLHLAAATARAQVPDTVRGPRPTPTLTLPRGDAKPPITPRRAFFYSLLAPGYAQSVLNRPTAGSIFVTVEAGALVMLGKSTNDLRAARRLARDSVVTGYKVNATTGDTTLVKAQRNGAARAASRIPARRAFVEDWLTLLIVNHFLAGADAYVAANLWDVPTDVTVSAAPRGGMRIGASLQW